MSRRFRQQLLSCILALVAVPWLACEDSDPTGSNSGIPELEPGTAIWSIGRSDSFTGLAVYQYVAATPDFDARTNIALSTSEPGKGTAVEVSIRLPEVTVPSTYTETGCEAFVDVAGYPLPIEGVETRWKSCCGIRRVHCTPKDIRCRILEVGPDGILGTFSAQLFYADGFSVYDSTEIAGAFFAVASE